jgi:TonB-dependent receptor-like protein
VTRNLALAPLLALALPSAAAASGTARVCVELDGVPAQAHIDGEGWARPATLELAPGRSCFYEVPAGEQQVAVRVADRAPAQVRLSVLPGEDVELRAHSTATAVTLAVSTRSRRALGTGFDARRMRDLPGSGEPWSLIETVEGVTIADRIDGGGLWAGQPGRFSVHGSSWTQTSFSLGPLDATDPLGTGTPLLWPVLASLSGFDVATAALPAEVGPPGAQVTLFPPVPPDRWAVSAEASTTLGEGRAAGPPESTPTSGPEPPVARLESAHRFSASAGGRFTESLRASLTGLLDDAHRFERGAAAPVDGAVRALDAQLLWTPGDRHEVRLLSSLQSLRRPYAGGALFAEGGLVERDRLTGLAADWRARRASGAVSWAGLGHRWGSIDADGGRVPGTFERLLEGPAPELPLPGHTGRARTDAAAGAQLAPRRLGGTWHALRLGAQAARTSATVERPATVQVGELLDGRPARAWTFTASDSKWHATDLALHATDAVTLGRTLRVEAGLRFETTRADAEGADERIRWTTLSPRLLARWQPAGPVALFASYAHYRHRLPLGVLAWGDWAAPRAEVFLWSDRSGNGLFEPGEQGTLVARAGPGAPVGRLDEELRPPRSEEIAAGVEGRFGALRVALSGVRREERSLLESLNEGVPASAYTVTFIPDPSGDINGSADDQLLPLYARPPGTFGDDLFLLTNPDGHDTTHQGVELTFELLTDRVQLLLAATAHRSDGQGAWRGFRPVENDQGRVGDLYDDPNTLTNAEGRLFSDRAYTIKLAGSWRAPGDVRLGAVARYQDGQPFARLVLADLPQGLTPVQAIPNGRARFTFIATLDARVEKGFALGARGRAALVLEGFNLTQRGNEVEEVVVTGPDYRRVTFREPPRTLRLGLRLETR